MQEIKLYGDVTRESVDFILGQLDSIEGECLLRIDSFGGDLAAAITLHNRLIERGNVSVQVDGICASAATIIALGGSKVSTASASLWLLHNPWSIAVGNADELRQEADALDKFAEVISGIYLKRIDATSEELREMLDAGEWLDAEQVFDLGLADEIILNDATANNVEQGVVMARARIAGLSEAVANSRRYRAEIKNLCADLSNESNARKAAEERLATLEKTTNEQGRLIESLTAFARLIPANSIAPATVETDEPASIRQKYNDLRKAGKYAEASKLYKEHREIFGKIFR